VHSDREHFNILVIGKSGNGKSAVCNTLLGKEQFKTGRSMSVTTVAYQYAKAECLGKYTIKVGF
jgi:predicted GTPase